MTRLFAVVSAITLLCVAGFASAVGLGDITLRSALTEPLEAEIRITSPGDFSAQDLNVRLATPADFSRAGIERPFFLTQIDFTLRQVGNAMSVVLTTADAVEEPFLDFVVELTWPGGRLLREYTLLLDPPMFADGDAGQIRVFPTQAPPRPVPVAPRQQQLADNQYRVENNDTLWEIALLTRQNPGQTPQQIMLAIQDLNPHAFINDNINRVKAGSLLTLPNGEQVAVRSRAQAVLEVDRQNRALRGLPPRGQSQISATGDAASATGSPAQRDPDGFLELVGTPSDSDAGGAEGEASSAEVARLQNDLAIQQELNDELRRQNQEQLSRLTELEEQVALLSQMMELQSASAADLQAAARALADEVEEGQEGTATAPAADDQPGMSATPETSPPAVVLEPMATAPTLMDQAMVWLDRVIQWVSQPINAAISALALFVVLAVASVARRRKEEALASEMEDEQGSSDFDDDLDLSGDDDPEQQSFTPANSEMGSAASAEAIENAELYIAFQRFDEAESVLKQALTDEPSNTALQLKMLELYAENGQPEEFEALAAEVEGNNGDAVARLRAQMAAVAPAAASMTGFASESDDEFADLDLDLESDDEWDSSTALDSMDDDLSLDFITETERTDPLRSDDLPELDVGLEDELSLDVDLPELGDEVDSTDKPTRASDPDDSLMGFDLGDWAVPEESAPGEAAAREADDLSLEMDFDLSSLDDEADELPSLDLSSEDVSDDESLDDKDSGAESELGLDDDFTRSLSDTLDQLSDEEEDVSLEAEDFADLGDLSDLDDFDRTVGDTALTDGGLEDFDLSDDLTFSADDESFTEPAKAGSEEGEDWDDDFDFLAGSDEVSTKLDLARAYIDMDDAEGARDILTEVMEEGNAEQKASAEALIRKL